MTVLIIYAVACVVFASLYIAAGLKSQRCTCWDRGPAHTCGKE